MRKRNHYELAAASSRAQMRSHALSWRAHKTDPHASMLIKEHHEEAIATDLMCAKSYRDNAASYDKMGRDEREDAERKLLPPLPDGPDRVLINGEPVICPGCKMEIDPHTCYCGGRIPEDSHAGHAATPIGCRCGFPKDPPKDEVPF